MPKSTNRRRYSSPVGKLETPKQVRSAWTYIHQQANADRLTPEEVRAIKIRVRRAAEGFGSRSSKPEAVCAPSAKALPLP
jgi:hypothetical protein